MLSGGRVVIFLSDNLKAAANFCDFLLCEDGGISGLWLFFGDSHLYIVNKIY
mgnify:CR=1 FL=1